MRRWFGVWTVAWLVGTTAALGQPERIVRVHPLEVVVVSLGESTDAEIHITVASGFHVQANPAANEFLIPLTVDFEDAEGVEARRVRYPPGRPYRLRGAEDDLLVYGDTFAVTVSVAASGTAGDDAVVLPGLLRYQACDERLCLAPTALNLELQVRVSSSPRDDP